MIHLKQKTITMEVSVDYEMYHDKDNGFSIYSVAPVDSEQELGRIKLTRYGNFTVKGNTFPLEVGATYTIDIGKTLPDPSKQYPDSYELRAVHPPKLETIQEQNTYIKSIVSEKQFELLTETFKDKGLVDVIKDGDLKEGVIKGIGEKTIQRWKGIIANEVDIAQLKVLLAEYGFTVNKLNSIQAQFGNAMVAYHVIKENPYALAQLSGWGFATVDSAIQKNGVAYDRKQRVRAATEYILQQAQQQGHTWVEVGVAIKEVDNLTSEPTEMIKEVMQHKNFTIEGNKIATTKAYMTEKNIAYHLKRISDNANTIETLELAQAIEGVEIKQGFQFTEEQRQAIYNAHTHGVSVLTGGAGTGKSATIKGIALTTPQLNYATMALSGRAVDVISEKGINSATIHRALGINHREGKRAMLNQHNNNKPFDPITADIIIIDEFSMIDAPMYERILSTIESGTRLVLVGDHGQLPAIGYGDVARDLIETESYPVTHLTQIHRQALESGIIELAYKFRNGETFLPSALPSDPYLSTMGKRSDVKLIITDERTNIPSYLTNVLQQFKANSFRSADDLLDLQIVAPMRKRGDLSVININNHAQNIFNPVTSQNKDHTINIGATTIRTGDKVMASGNSYDIPLLDPKTYRQMGEQTTSIFNGAMGIVRFVHRAEKTIIIEFPTEKGYVLFAGENIEKLDLAYCSTVHKLQGSSAKHVIFVVDYSSYIMLNKQLLYVGVTRAEEGLIMIGEKKALEHSLRTDASTQRNTFLKEMLLTNKGV